MYPQFNEESELYTSSIPNNHAKVDAACGKYNSSNYDVMNKLFVTHSDPRGTHNNSLQPARYPMLSSNSNFKFNPHAESLVSPKRTINVLNHNAIPFAPVEIDCTAPVEIDCTAPVEIDCTAPVEIDCTARITKEIEEPKINVTSESIREIGVSGNDGVSDENIGGIYTTINNLWLLLSIDSSFLTLI